MSGTLAKPQLRRLLISSLQKHIPFAMVLAVSASLTMKYFVTDVRREKVAEFYRTYDVEKEAEYFRAMGFFERKDA